MELSGTGNGHSDSGLFSITLWRPYDQVQAWKGEAGLQFLPNFMLDKCLTKSRHVLAFVLFALTTSSGYDETRAQC